MNITTKPQEHKPMSESDYKRYVIKLKSNAKKAWKKTIFATGKTIKEFERTSNWVPFEVLKQHYKPQNN